MDEDQQTYQHRAAYNRSIAMLQRGRVLNNETFPKAFTQGQRMYFDDSEYDFPHVASRMNTLDAVCSVLDEDGKGGYPLIG